jgi:hypothetical protein
VHRLRCLRTGLPVSAIFPVDDLPEQWKHFTEINASYVDGGKFIPQGYAMHQGVKLGDP